MQARSKLCGMVVALAALVATQVASANSPESVTEITIQGEFCKGCLKKIKAKMVEVPNIADVQADIKAKVVMVYPADNAQLSPRALWEAVEKAGKKPAQLAGPHGTFTSKPER